MEITNELLASYAEGNVSDSERNEVRQYLIDNPKELETVMMMMDEDYDIQLEETESLGNIRSFDFELDRLLEDVESPVLSLSNSYSRSILPMMSMAAQNNVDNLCAIRCEGIALRKLGVKVDDEELIHESKEEGIIKEEGTALYNIGRLAGLRGLNVAHRYKCTFDDISKSLSDGDVVLAVVDSTELQEVAPSASDQDENEYNPNHVVVVTSIYDDIIKIVDSSTNNEEDSYSLTQFGNAWEDSSNYLIIISKNNNYEPHPIDLSEVTLSGDLLELRDTIAENAHEVWAFNRMKEGWSYGPFRDDENKLHPDLIPYNRLTESEKEYDREMAMNTIKLVQKLGWELKKKQ